MSSASRATRPRAVAILLLIIAFSIPRAVSGQALSFTRAPVADVVKGIEESTPYRFLYRDALVAGVRVTLDIHGDEVLSTFDYALRDHRLRLQVDRKRKMVFILPLPDASAPQNLVIQGTVSDAVSLERLPHATLVWEGPDGFRGAVTDDGGRFLIRMHAGVDVVPLVVSFVGYAPDTLRLSGQHLPQDLSIKLQPRVMLGSEVVVSSPLLSSNLDSTWYHLLGTALATPVGEESVTRALQMLPAVGLTTAVSSGLNVRGSRTDGFQILLDGIPIYNQSHLFGMFDAFNPDALQAVDFYYGIAPARFQAPPGGTLSFLTRAGSKRSFHARAGITTTAASGTIEGPIGNGKGSWILSARRSYIDNINWFNNEGLIEMGLGVNRDNSGTRRIPLDQRTLATAAPSANFYDVHAKMERESGRGATFQISGYVGGDRTQQDGIRIIALSPQRQDPRIRSQVTTEDNWGNAAFTVHYRSAVRPSGFSHTYAGFTRYHSSFRKDDFFYRTPAPGNADPQLLFAPFLNDNNLTEVRLAHESTLSPSPTLDASLGFSGQWLVAEYNELSALRNEFATRQRTWQLDLFAEVTKSVPGISATVGLRPQYFSAGKYLRMSPRLTLATEPVGPMSASLGYTRNYQFVHRLYIENAAGSDLWVLTNAAEPPGAVDHITASLLYRGKPLTAQLEGFLKWQDNLRRHETVLRPGGIPEGAVLLSPWTHDNHARAKGIEALLSLSLPYATLTTTYTLSRVEISHPNINDGAYFLADWDRPNQLMATAQASIARNLSLSISANVATGLPNPLAYLYPSERLRYPTYRRVDFALEYRQAFRSNTLDAFFRVYNLFATHNVWYRTAETVLQGRGPNIRLAFEPVDVYDLGLQPTLGLSVSF